MEVVREVFPNAKIIIDRFHLVQALNRELNKLRIEVMNAFRVPDHRLYNKYKRYWRIFLMPRENLNSWDYQPFKLFDWLTNTGGILDYLLDKNPFVYGNIKVQKRRCGCFFGLFQTIKPSFFL